MAAKYKVRLASGRVLGPLDLERFRLLVLKGQIVGTESARPHPKGDWVGVNSIPDLADALIAHLEGRLVKSPDGLTQILTHRPGPGEYTAALPTLKLEDPAAAKAAAEAAMAPTRVELQTSMHSPSLPAIELPTATRIAPDAPDALPSAPLRAKPDGGTGKIELEQHPNSANYAGPKVKGFDPEGEEATTIDDSVEATQLTEAGGDLRPQGIGEIEFIGNDRSVVMSQSAAQRNISQEKTIVLQRSAPLQPGQSARHVTGKKRLGPSDILKIVVIGALLGFFGYDTFLNGAQDKQTQQVRMPPLRPRLPDSTGVTPDPALAEKYFAEAMKFYARDTVSDYRKSAQLLLQACQLDMNNVKALAMLASCYLNLIDVSNKDERYFSVISQLIDLSRSKSIDLPETVIADVEFYVTAKRPEAAQQRIVEYTKTHPKFPVEMYFYLALAFYNRGDAASASRYLGVYPEKQFFSPRVFYLRAEIAQKLGDEDAAARDYKSAIDMTKQHSRSMLKLAQIMARQGKLKASGKYLKYIVDNNQSLAPADLAAAYALYSQLVLLNGQTDEALSYIERAVTLDPKNHDYLFEVYTLRGRLGDTQRSVAVEARMYELLSQGEHLTKDGKNQEALAKFLEARQANLKSPVPLMKIGEMFIQMKDMANARLNFQLAAERAPQSIGVWSKYIDVLIQSYEWEAATKAMEKFRRMDVPQSAIDKAAGDLYAKQGQYTQAQEFYRKAMARETIDSGVYIAYANALVASKNYKDATFFYALSMRFDPLNMDAIVGNAKAVAAAESVDRAVIMLQDELEKMGGARAELLAAIAELQIQKGEWALAQNYIDQAMAANPDYALPWKLQAQVHLNREGIDKHAVDSALGAFRSYSDRNQSDPSGYLERYKIYTKRLDFEKANAELERIYAVYPKYPNLHYYKGTLYAVMGNHKTASEEFGIELKNNPDSIPALLGQGKELLEMGQPNEAIKGFNRAISLAPKAAEPRMWAGAANQALKNYQAAIALYKAALSFDSGNPLLYKRLGLAYKESGDQVEARAAFKRYLQMEPDASDKAEIERLM